LRNTLFVAALFAAAPALAADQPVPVTGHWITEDGKALVEITACGTSLCGRVAKILDPDPNRPTTDSHNPDPAKRGRPLLGLTILSGFAVSGQYWKGQIYDPKSGSTYRSYLKIDNGQLNVQGCVGPFCQTQHWRRAN